jgi:hypothetical protein
MPFSGASVLPGLFMNDYYSRRSSRPAGIFSFGLLDGPQGIAVSRNGRLTKTRPAHHLAGVHTRDAPYPARRGPRRRAQTWRFIHRAVRLVRSPRKRCVSAHLGWEGEMGLRSQLLRDAVHE